MKFQRVKRFRLKIVKIRQKIRSLLILPTPHHVLQFYGKILKFEYYQQPLEINSNDGTIKYKSPNPKHNSRITYGIQTIPFIICIISAVYCIALRVLFPQHSKFLKILPINLIQFLIMLSFSSLMTIIVVLLLPMIKPVTNAFNALIVLKNMLKFGKL